MAVKVLPIFVIDNLKLLLSYNVLRQVVRGFYGITVNVLPTFVIDSLMLLYSLLKVVT